MKRLLVIFIMLMSFFTSNSNAESVNYDDLKAQIMSCLEDILVDPDSAKIKFGPYVQRKELFCVKINAKNRMGGYGGYKTGYFSFKNGKLSMCNNSSLDQRLGTFIFDCTGATYE